MTISVSVCVNTLGVPALLLMLVLRKSHTHRMTSFFWIYQEIQSIDPNNDLLCPQEEANTDQPLPRFNFASEEKLSKLGEGLVSDNTSSSTKSALKNFSSWKDCRSSGGQSTLMHKCDMR